MSEPKKQFQTGQSSIIGMVLEGMHPAVKAAVFAALAVPLVLALSGMMLQIRAGELIEEAIRSYGDKAQVAVTETLDVSLGSDLRLIAADVKNLTSAVANINASIADVHARIGNVENNVAAATSEVAKLSQQAKDQADQINTIRQELNTLSSRWLSTDEAVRRLRSWACAKDNTPLYRCDL